MARRRCLCTVLLAAGACVVAVLAAGRASANGNGGVSGGDGGGDIDSVQRRSALTRDTAVDVSGQRIHGSRGAQAPGPRGRIVNGRVVGATEGDAGVQFMAKLFLPGGTRFYCSGAMLSYRTLLTAAHCFTGGTSTPVSAVGDVVRVGGRGLFDGIVTYIEDVQTHPTFDITTYLGDIAVVKLAGTFTPAEAIRMGMYPAKLGTPDMLTLGTQLTLSGWGVTNTIIPPEGDVNGDAGPDTTSDAVHGAGDDWALDASPSLDAGSDDGENSSEDSGLGAGHVSASDAGEGGSEVSPAPEVTDDDFYFYTAGRWADDAVAAAGRPAPVLHRPVDPPVRAGDDVVVTPAPAVRMETLSKPGTLLTAKVFSQPMDKCSTFAEEVIGVSNYSTSFYDEALEVCLSLNDMVAACDGDSGSPFFTQAPHPQGFYSYFVHAVMSFSYPSPTEDCPVAYFDIGTRVSAYHDWIVPRIVY